MFYFPAELEGCPKCTCELNFTVTIIISFSLIAAVFIIIVAIAILLRKVIKGRNNQKKKENKPIENIIYEDIEQHQPSLSFCDTTENIAYSNTASCK
ncbi:MAG: hypothetical protein MJE68_33125 [Proteobacteria bacterium]|nr:hypothetical protein [Pseudomonadota bacterium]